MRAGEQVRRGLLVLLLLLLTACGGPSRATYSSPQRAIEGFQNMSVKVYQEIPSGDDRLVIFQGERHVAPVVAYVNNMGWGRWQMELGMYIGALHNIGPVSFANHSLGRVEEKVGEVTHIYARTLVFYGTVNDPRLTWVEVTLPEAPNQPQKAQVVNGTWLVQWPWQIGFPPSPKASLRAGDDSGELFAVPNVYDLAIRQ